MNIYIYILLNCIICVTLLFPINTFAQTPTFDSIRLDKIDLTFKSIEEIQIKRERERSLFQNLSSNFCFLNNIDSVKASKVFRIFRFSRSLEKSDRHKFFIKNVDCFNNEQLNEIVGTLNVKLNPTDAFYHRLVSSFNLRSQTSYLKHHISDSLFVKIKRNFRNGTLNKWYTLQLRNMATLINIEERQMEDDYLEQINYLYSYFKKQNELDFFYRQILSNSISILNSKKSIMATFYMLDEITKSPIEGYADVGYQGHSFQYLKSCILPKLKSTDIELMAWTNFEANKEKIKELILNDNTIWLDIINIENE